MFQESGDKIAGYFDNATLKLSAQQTRLDGLREKIGDVSLGFRQRDRVIAKLQRENVNNARIVGKIKTLTIDDFPNHPRDDLNGENILLIDQATGLPHSIVPCDKKGSPLVHIRLSPKVRSRLSSKS